MMASLKVPSTALQQFSPYGNSRYRPGMPGAPVSNIGRAPGERFFAPTSGTGRPAE